MTRRFWEPEDDAYLLQHYSSSSVEDLAQKLDRSPEAVKKRYYMVHRNATVNDDLSLEMKWVLARAGSPQPKALKKIKGASSVTSATPIYTPKSRRGGNAFRNTNTGFRPDLGFTVRSGWEANILRILKSYSIEAEFEPKIFQFPVKRGNRAYTPDIYLPGTDEWIEIKGWLDNASKVKIRRFKRYYPQEFSKFTMIIGSSSKAARAFCLELNVPQVLFYDNFSSSFKSLINNWEGR